MLTDRAHLTEPADAPAGTRRAERAVAFFGTWVIAGLFLDGWAHRAEKPETFFSPWHAVLYSGFLAGVLWLAWDARSGGRSANPTGRLDRLTTVGLGVFVLGAVGDGLWHEIFGIEVDVEALVSPSHLALLIGGFLMVASPIRLALGRRDATVADPVPMGWADWLPLGVSLTLSTGLVAFFTQYLSPFEGVGGRRAPEEELRELQEITGIASVLVFNALLIVALVFALRRWRPPAGAATLLFGAVAIGMSGLEGFELVELAVPAIAAGLVADLLVARATPVPLVTAAASLVLWCGFFLVGEASYGLAWSVELWSGSIVLAVASSLLLAAVVRRPASG